MIGGGINGAAIARDAAMRGLKVALFDRGDFAGATSSRSSKLIHGGFRYLPQGQLRLVYTALRERERLHRVTAPHLVKPIRFLFPFYRGRGFNPLVVAAGMMLYDRLARTPKPERHRRLDAAGVIALEPGLAAGGLRGGSLYYDAWADDARLTLENALDAAAHGAVVANYVALEAFSKSGGKVASAALGDRISGDAFELRARLFVNAAGPWVDDIRRLDDPAATAGLRLTKGVHLVFDRDSIPVRESLVLADKGGRIVFVMPHGRYVLVGTTDTDFTGEREAVAADRADIDYLLEVLGLSLPGIRLGAANVVSSFAGLRALVHSADARSPSAVPREETILESGAGLITVAGGKLTTHREIAERVVNRVMIRLGRPIGRCPTIATPLLGARPSPVDAPMPAGLAPELRESLAERYGTRQAIVARLIVERPALAEPLAPGCPVVGAEVIHAIRNELAVTLADFVVRRTAMVWRYPREAVVAAPRVAALIAEELGWDAARVATELASFRSALESARRAA